MKFLFIQSCAPHGSINAQEGLDAVLMGSAFTECTLLFIGEGVLQLIRHQETAQLGMKNFSLSFGALRDYGVSRIYCKASSLADYQLKLQDLVIDVEALSDQAIRNLLNEHDRVLNF